jgi:group II intron reverse transcriptase/maturase
MTERNSEQTAEPQAQNWANSLTGLSRIREAARGDRRQRFTSLMHHITPGLLNESFHSLKRKAAAGVDKMTWHEYADGLAGRLSSLHERVQSGRYRARPSKRIYIPKEDGRKRPIGIATLEDKIVQGAVVRILEQIYEVDFLGYNYGFRPGRSPHNALDAVSVGIETKRINYILDADLHSFFDMIDHEWMERFLEHRIADRRLIRLIKKWLRAGVSEEGEWSRTKAGTPQGAVISPMLANIFLHYVLDLWVQKWRKRNAKGDVIYIRWADDFVMGFQSRNEAEHFHNQLKERLSKFKLELNEGKTRIIKFGRNASRNSKGGSGGKPGTFDFLGFTHICSQTRKTRQFKIHRKPVSKRSRRKLQEIKRILLNNRDKPIPEQGKWLRSVVQGYFNYFAVPGTAVTLTSFRSSVGRYWYKALRRRSHTARKLTWDKMTKLVDTWLPKVRIVHPYPNQRLRV